MKIFGMVRKNKCLAQKPEIIFLSPGLTNSRKLRIGLLFLSLYFVECWYNLKLRVQIARKITFFFFRVFFSHEELLLKGSISSQRQQIFPFK